MRGFLAAVLWIPIGTNMAAAQTPDFSHLDARPGDIIYVSDMTSGVKVSGQLRSLAPLEISIDGYSFHPTPGLRIERLGDSIWDGAAIGAAAGALLGATVGPEACLHSSQWRCAVGGAMWTGAIGALIDWAHKGRTVIYESRPSALRRVAGHIVPLVSRREKAVALSFSF